MYLFFKGVFFSCSFVQKKETPLSNSSTEEAFQGEINQLGQADLSQRKRGFAQQLKEGKRGGKDNVIFLIKSLKNLRFQCLGLPQYSNKMCMDANGKTVNVEAVCLK